MVSSLDSIIYPLQDIDELFLLLDLIILLMK